MRTSVHSVIDHPIWRWKLKLLRVIMFTCSVSCTALVFLQVVTRYVFSYSIFGVEEAASFLAVTMYFIGAAYATHERSHISASIMDSFLSDGRMKYFTFVLTRLITVGLSIFLVWQTWDFIGFTYQMGTRSVELRLPMIIVYSAMLTGFALMAFYFIIDLMDSIRSLILNSR